MADVPEDMKQKERVEDPCFAPDEELYRRFPPDHFERDTVTIEAIELPDMSVNREKYGPPQWVLVEIRENDNFEGWGVLAFEVRNVPAEMPYRGTRIYTFGPKHEPERLNYPHSEIRAYENGNHVDFENAVLLEPEIHQRWRQRLLWKCRPVIKPVLV